VRIVGGRWRGLGLAAVGKGDAKAHLRPTTDRVRESMFNLLVNGGFGDPLVDARVLDLFAGTGALGLEALSRDAATATFVDSGRVSQRLIADNIAKTKAKDVTRIIRQDATKLGQCDDKPATLVFVDPPYGKSLGQAALEAAVKGNWLAEGAIVVWEEATPPGTIDGFTLLDQRRYGDTHLTILEYLPNDQAS